MRSPCLIIDYIIEYYTGTRAYNKRAHDGRTFAKAFVNSI